MVDPPQLLVEPIVATLVHDTDYFGNVVHHFALQEAHKRLSVTAVSEVDVVPYEAPAMALTDPWETVQELISRPKNAEALSAYELTFESPHVRCNDEATEYARESFKPGRPLLEAAFELTRRIYEEFEYKPGSTTVATPVREVMKKRRGVCQDFAHLQIAMLRGLGLSARYVSGYIYNQAPEGKPPALVGADASHAWLSVYCPRFGFIDLDPTNGLIPRDEHVTLAWGRDFSDTSPLKGVILGGGEHVVKVGVDVSRIDRRA